MLAWGIALRLGGRVYLREVHRADTRIRPPYMRMLRQGLEQEAHVGMSAL